MHPDVSEIEKFYRRTASGRFAQTQLSRRVKAIWPDMRGFSVVGFGFTPPIFTELLSQSCRLTCLMPERQGVKSWPVEGPNVAVLTSESEWPISTGTANRIVMLHALETSLNVAAVLDECWRVLAPEGRMLIIVPNRAGLWSRSEVTPFGAGRPFTAGQLTKILGNRRFGVINSETALFAPPSQRGFWNRSAPFLEKIGNHAPLNFAGGALLLEAHKRVFQMHTPPIAETVAKGLKALEGMTAPGTKPVSNRQGIDRSGRL